MVRKKKEVMRPVVAKPLNDTDKRNLVTSFVTTNVNEDITNKVNNNDTNSITENEQNDVIDNITEQDTSITTNEVTNIDTNEGTDNKTNSDTVQVTSNGTNIVNNNVTNGDTKLLTNIGTDEVTKSVTKRVAKNVTIIKSITLGKKDIIAKFTSDKRLRPNYNLSEDTVEKIEKISDILGYKKAEFVDIYLNGTLDKILKDLEKSL